MRKLSVLFLAGTLLLVPLCGCAQSSSQTQADGQAQTDGKYDEIIADLEEEDYDGAIDAITEMKKESQAKAFGDIKDYLVTVELTKENFDEYFEWVSQEHVDAFGEKDSVWWGFRSKKYDDGLILYRLEDVKYCDSILIEHTSTYHNLDDSDQSVQEKDELSSLLSMISWDVPMLDPVTLDSVDRIAGSKLTFIKKEFVESYDFKPFSFPEDSLGTETITLKNGEILTRASARDYPY